ncbi:MAG: PAS domain-containing protein [Candidatus Izemoplasmatales bacterium]
MEVFKYNNKRVEKVNEFMRRILATDNTETKVKIYKEYEEEILSLNPLDIFYLDFYSDNSTLTISEIKNSANRFVNVFHKGISRFSDLGDAKLFNELLKENKIIQDHLAKIKQYYKKEVICLHKKDLLDIFYKCNEFNLKFIKYQNIIFPNLEKVIPSNKPLEVLWELHDDAQSLLKTIIELLKEEDSKEEELIKQIGTYHYLVFGICQKEELILLPVMKQLLDIDKLNEIYNECIDVGFVFNQDKLEKIKTQKDLMSTGFFSSNTGKMSIKELILMLNHLPLDITFVDKNDYVLYYNESKNRHFPRTPSVIGRLVKNCHPPKSVHIVEGIIEDFKAKRKDFEDFWINFKGQTLYIAYYAVRDDENNYLGVLEVSQDISRFQQIKGEKRLSDY